MPALAMLTAATGVPGLLAVLLHMPALGQPQLGFSAVRPLSNALLFVCAAGLLLLWLGRRTMAMVAAAITLLASVVGLVVGVVSPEQPLGMAVVVSIMFGSFAIALGITARAPSAHRTLVIVGSIGAMLLAIAGVLVLAELGDLLQTALGRRIAQVSLSTLLGQIALSAGLLRYVAAQEPRGVAPPRWLPVAVGVTGALLMLVFWQSLIGREEAESRARAEIASDAVQRAILRQFDVIERSVMRIGLYLQSATSDVPLWDTSVSRLTAETVGLQRVLWFDSTGRILRGTADTSLAPGLASTLREWVRDRSISMQVRAIEPTGIVLVHQVAEAPTGAAVLTAFVSEAALLADFTSDTSSGFAIRAFIGDSLVAGRARSSRGAVLRSDLQLGERHITLTFTPDPVPVRSTFPEMLLLLGLAVAGLAAATLWQSRKRWEQASEVGMARMQRAIERSTDGVWELDLLNGHAHRSGALVRALGYDPAFINGDASVWSALMHPDDAARVSDALRAHIRGETEVFECEYRVRASNDSWHTFVERGRVIDRTIDGQPARLLGISADITERALAKEALERGERRFRAMFDSAFQLQLLLDLDGTILEANRAAADFAGRSVEEMRGTTFAGLSWWNATDGTPARVQERFQRVAGGETTRFEVATRRADDTDATTDFSMRPIRDANEHVVQVLAEGHDLTDRSRTQESLRLIGALTTMGQLAARVAHEINNPLAGIQNAFLLVRDGIPESHPHYRFVGAIEREIARIAAVTRQLYETYRPDQEMSAQSSVILAIGDAVSFLEQVNISRQVRITTDVSRAPSLVPVPDALLRQTLYNLVQNALDATPPNGAIEVSAVEEDGWCVIRVADEGPGVPEDIRERIFEPFFSTKNRSIKTGGMGIGLSLVRQSVLAVGGYVRVHDRPEGGTMFEVRLPMQPIETGVLR